MIALPLNLENLPPIILLKGQIPPKQTKSIATAGHYNKH